MEHEKAPRPLYWAAWCGFRAYTKDPQAVFAALEHLQQASRLLGHPQWWFLEQLDQKEDTPQWRSYWRSVLQAYYHYSLGADLPYTDIMVPLPATTYAQWEGLFRQRPQAPWGTIWQEHTHKWQGHTIQLRLIQGPSGLLMDGELVSPGGHTWSAYPANYLHCPLLVHTDEGETYRLYVVCAKIEGEGTNDVLPNL